MYATWIVYSPLVQVYGYRYRYVCRCERTRERRYTGSEWVGERADSTFTPARCRKGHEQISVYMIYARTRDSTSSTRTSPLPLFPHFRMIFSRSSAPFNRARRYSSRPSYRPITSARRRRISASSCSMLINSSSSIAAATDAARLLPDPEPVEPTSERVDGDIGLVIVASVQRELLRMLPLRLVVSRGRGRSPASPSSTVSSGRWPVLRAKFTLELLARPGWRRCTPDNGVGGAPCLPRDDTDDIDALCVRTGGAESGDVADGTGRIFAPYDGVRLSERAVRPEPLDLNDIASKSFPERALSVPAGQPPSDRAPCEGRGGMTGGFRRRWRVRVESSRPLKASSRRRPSASTTSIWCRMSCTDSTWSSSGMSWMLMWV